MYWPQSGMSFTAPMTQGILLRYIFGVATCFWQRSASDSTAANQAGASSEVNSGQRDALAPEALAVAGSEGCWQGGYTRDICCRENSPLNCWDAVFTFRRCCGSATKATQTLTVVAASAPKTEPKTLPSYPGVVSGKAKVDATSTTSGDDASCWRGGYTYARCCKVPSVVAAIDGCWDTVYTESRCCGSAPDRRELKPAAIATSAPNVGPTSVGATEPADKRLKSPGDPVADIASGVASGEFVPTKLSGSVSKLANDGDAGNGVLPAPGVAAILAAAQAHSADAKPGVHISTSKTGALAPSSIGQQAHDDDASQARFLRREGSRRWASYFRKAHSLLNDLLETKDALGGDASMETSDDGITGLEPDVDQVQLYHLLYEVVNQIIGGIQLASQASTHEESMSEDGGKSGATLRAAFLSAAVVLARLAQASSGTPFQHEEFSAQAGAAIALSCRQQNAAAFAEDLANRIQWLQREAGTDTSRGGGAEWSATLLDSLRRRMNSTEFGKHVESASTNQVEANPSGGDDSLEDMYQRSWQMYSEDLAEAVWRPANAPADDGASLMGQTTLNPLDEEFTGAARGRSHVWQIFPTYVMAKPLFGSFARRGADAKNDLLLSEDGASEAGKQAKHCPACSELTHIVIDKYKQFELAMENESSSDRGTLGRTRMRADEVNNAFFAWQLTHESEQQERGDQVWPELYRDSKAFQVLKHSAKLACLEYLQNVYDASLSALDLAQLELSIWASVTPAQNQAAGGSGMGLAFHDHPLALLSGVFYAQAGGKAPEERTPTVFADPRGVPPFRYTTRPRKPHDPLEPIAPFHRLAYAHASDGLALIFPSWLVHGVPPHIGPSTRVAFAFNLHTLHGTTLSSWAKTAL